MIRRKTIGEQDRADRSIRDHMNIIQAIEARDTARAEELVRNHALGLADHVGRHADYLDQMNLGQMNTGQINTGEVSNG
jgi:DNA-binding GntR family transcriptional regulator